MKKYVPIRSKKIPFSQLIHKKSLYITMCLLLLTFVVMVFSTGMGELTIHPVDVVKAMVGIGEAGDILIVQTFRLPRVLVGLLVGASLAVSGALLQGIIRNPLASPDIIGITGGASVAAVAFITFMSTVSVKWLPLAAIVGAFIVAITVYLLAWKKGVTPLRLVLIGVGIGAAMSALTTLMIVVSPIYLTSKAIIWMTGSIYGTTWSDVLLLLPWTLILIPSSIIFARSLNIQQLGEDVATSVGNAVERHRLLLLFLSVALAGSAVSVGGAIGFVGLLAPHIARKLVGSVYGALIPVSAFIGALIVLIADLIGRLVFSPLDLPVGIFTSAIGAPFFIYMLYRSRNQ